ncbi:hypothetical protein, partial [Gluconobacter oxydans]|uniref:hypothetical protein n=1 Tax=Gluconobacter oxydans TaxID=442 RepID=UPI00209DD7D3
FQFHIQFSKTVIPAAPEALRSEPRRVGERAYTGTNPHCQTEFTRHLSTGKMPIFWDKTD